MVIHVVLICSDLSPIAEANLGLRFEPKIFLDRGEAGRAQSGNRQAWVSLGGNIPEGLRGSNHLDSSDMETAEPCPLVRTLRILITAE